MRDMRDLECFDRVLLEKTETAASEFSKRDANGPSASSQ